MHTATATVSTTTIAAVSTNTPTSTTVTTKVTAAATATATTTSSVTTKFDVLREPLFLLIDRQLCKCGHKSQLIRRDLQPHQIHSNVAASRFDANHNTLSTIGESIPTFSPSF
jgi:hypothetical protein